MESIMFKEGDKIRMIQDVVAGGVYPGLNLPVVDAMTNHRGVKLGGEYTVKQAQEGAVMLLGYGYVWPTCVFEMVCALDDLDKFKDFMNDPLRGGEPIDSTDKLRAAVEDSPNGTAIPVSPEVLAELSFITSGLVTKETNPKEAYGLAKPSLDLVSPLVTSMLSLAQLEGALKYGAYNWRVAGVKHSTYHSALLRHIGADHAGQDIDPESNIPHLVKAMACLHVMIDAKIHGKLNDDRPPAIADLDAFNADMEAIVK
jgi:hypothetical protein